MTGQVSENKFQSWAGSRPRWQQIALFAACVIPAIAAIDVVKDKLSDSPQAKAIKQRIYPLQQQLDAAAKVGYILDPGTLNEGVSALVSEYNALSEVERSKINASPRKNCLIAVFNLSDGIDEVARHKTWHSKGKYLAAMSACK
ncbi:MAG: hypothetical protein KAY21_05590 [Limnohabitans sp.]|nr:hypothetical protein [Limnohabitans sp.]